MSNTEATNRRSNGGEPLTATWRLTHRAIAYGMRFRSPKQRKASVLGSLLGGAPEMTEDDERVAFYCNKLRSFLMPVHPWENLRFRNAALRIQRSFRKRREERVKRGNPRLATTAYLLNSGGKELPEDAFQRTMILQVSDLVPMSTTAMETIFSAGWKQTTSLVIHEADRIENQTDG
jgi:hypothetical protein